MKSRAAISISPPRWEAELHKRGTIRIYPFDSGTLQVGGNSAGSNVTYAAPTARVDTGAATATPQSRVREAVEKQGAAIGVPIWNGFDGLNWWGRIQRIMSFVTIDTGNITPADGFLMSAIFLGAPGVPTTQDFNAAPGAPFCILRYMRAGSAAASPDEHFDLITAPGDGVTAPTVTRLTGVNGPSSNITGGGPLTQRWEIRYKPGEYAAALIDGVLGALVTGSSLPNPAFTPGGAQSLAGIGAYLFNAQLNDRNFTTFTSLLCETYRP